MSHNILLFFDIKILLIISIYFSLIKSINIYALHNLIITSDINSKNMTSINYLYFSINTKGVGIIFDYNSEINLIPYHLIKQIKKYVEIYLLDGYSFLKEKENEYQELVFYGYMFRIISFNFITDNIGITFPNNVLFPKDPNSIGQFSFAFLSKEDQDNIIIGRNLIDLMKIEFNDKNEFIINNSSFISLVEE